MIEKKCKICGEWINSKKIAMHYWNIHHAKYSDYRINEETREVEDTIGETNEKKTSKETSTNSTTTTPEVKVEIPVQVEQVKPVEQTIEIQSTPIETEKVNEGLVEVPKTDEIKEAEMWKETAYLFDEPQTNEATNELRRVISVEEHGQSMNEWCN